MLSDTVMEALQAGYNRRVAEVRLRRREFTKRRKRKHRYQKAVQARLREKGVPIWTGPDGKEVKHVAPQSRIAKAWTALSGRNTTGAGRGSGRVPMRLNVAALSQEELDAVAKEADYTLPSTRETRRGRSRSIDRTGRPLPHREDSSDSANAMFARSFDEYKDNLESEKTKQFLARVRRLAFCLYAC
jgi:hypothetical protein